jgi:xanthine dehydrogenase YagT iron-sulfur-binding subunit
LQTIKQLTPITWKLSFRSGFLIKQLFMANKKPAGHPEEESCPNEARRDFLKQSSLMAALALMPSHLVKAAASEWDEKAAAYFEKVPLSLEVNGSGHKLSIEPRVTLLDLLREQLALTGTKKGCDHGQCGACTVHVDGRRVLSCMSLAVMLEGKKITTIERYANT